MIDLKDLMLSSPRLSLAVAESMTCGRIQAKIGLISGASQFFHGGITAYSLEQKVRHLGVSEEMASKVNCISMEVAEQMAQGACLLFNADLAIATTGYAEPAPEWNVKYPMAWWALAHDLKNGTMRVQGAMVECPGASRSEAQERVSVAALGGLMRDLRSLRANAV
jgi:nicotinamide-nucleotide amidase